MKVQLIREVLRPPAESNGRYKTIHLTHALPFYQTGAKQRVRYVHRVRSGRMHYYGGEYSHTSILFWCGNIGHMPKGKLMAEVPEHEVFCATCEGRAIGAGLDGLRNINGRFVLFQPRL